MQAYRASNRTEGQVDIKGTFVINGISAPDGIRGSGWTVARTGVGVFVVTITNAPAVFAQYDSFGCPGVHRGAGAVTTGFTAHVTAYDVTAGTFTISVFNAAQAAAEGDNNEICFDVTIRQFASPPS